ncbi:hypothetical protein HMPREF0742_02220 [Rothia aeria F0184]|uniref:Uncharacterized protein n=1 Tax=Rothia aeria F0184 TaxID=888019 RepID=U7UYB7_9MICC|nr:hypothetical protein HMPREF0742_02220 [Rothia aeria F0184]
MHLSGGSSLVFYTDYRDSRPTPRTGLNNNTPIVKFSGRVIQHPLPFCG